MPPRRPPSIERGLPLLFAGLLAVIVAGVVLAAHREVRQSARSAAIARISNVNRQLRDLLATSLRPLFAESDTVAGSQAFLRHLTAPDQATAAEATDSLGASTRRSGSSTLATELWSTDGARVALGGQAIPEVPAEERRWLIGAISAGGPAVISRFFMVGDVVHYGLITAIRRDGTTRGYVVHRMRLSGTRQESQQLASLIGAGESKLLLGNRDGTLWTDLAVPVTEPLTELAGRTGVFEHDGGAEPAVLAYADSIPATPWQIVVESPQSIVYQRVDQFLYRMLGFGAVLVVIGAGAGWLLSRSITRPLRQVTEAAEAMAADRAPGVLEETRADELRRLVTAFNAMSDRVTASRSRLAAMADRYRVLFDKNPCPMAVFDLETLAFTDVNEAAIRHYGWSRDEFLKMTVLDVRAPDEAGRIVEHLREEEDGLIQAGVWKHRKKDGTPIDMEIIRYRMMLDGRPVALTSAIDVTAKLAAERALRDSEEALRRLNAELELRVTVRTAELEGANKELEAFSYSVSHDLRGPLRAISGFSRILREDHSGNLSEEGLRVLGVIERSVLRMGHLIDDLLAFSRLARQPVVAAPVDMTSMVKGVAEELRGVEEGRAIELQLGPLPPALGSPSLLRQVVANYLQNAMKFTRGREPARIHVSGRVDNGEHVYSVKDNGVGFDMKTATKLFGVFERLHRQEEFEGTGVGLAIVHRIVQRHGGRVWAESTLGQGATFFFSLPVAGPPSVSVSTPTNERPSNSDV